MSGDVELLRRLYERFNARDMESLLAAMCENVVWANGMEGGHIHGRDGVRDYWTRQWAMLDPHVEPKGFKPGPDGEIIVDVHQVVHDLDGKLLVDQMAVHIFRFEDGLIRRFDIAGA
ncbi:MAG: nuclear transport factor 2 family protein [Silvibacterium sp.]|nr:nuclear transport factor 2 family protein [Silvibacterium sp.]